MRSERIRHDPLTRRVLGHQDASLMLSSPRCPAMVSRNGLPEPALCRWAVASPHARTRIRVATWNGCPF
jgi:hypothetical protein